MAVALRLDAPSTKFRAKLCSAREPDLVDRPGTARRARLAATSLAVARSNHYVFFSSSSFVRFCSDIIFIYFIRKKGVWLIIAELFMRGPVHALMHATRELYQRKFRRPEASRTQLHELTTIVHSCIWLDVVRLNANGYTA